MGRMASYFPPFFVVRRFRPFGVGKFGTFGMFVRNLVFLRTCRSFPVGKFGNFGMFVRNLVFLRTCRTCRSFPVGRMGIFAGRQPPERATLEIWLLAYALEGMKCAAGHLLGKSVRLGLCEHFRHRHWAVFQCIP